MAPGAADRNKALRAIKRLGRTIWRRRSGHHRRSRAETKRNRMKLLGQKPMARDVDRQTAEFQVPIAIPNRCTHPGIPVTRPVSSPHKGKPNLTLQAFPATGLAHAGFFHLDPEQVVDAGWRIELHIEELERLRAALSATTARSLANWASKIIGLPVPG